MSDWPDGPAKTSVSTKAHYMTSMLDAGVVIAPFTVDPLGGLGPTAHSLLFGKSMISRALTFPLTSVS